MGCFFYELHTQTLVPYQLCEIGLDYCTNVIYVVDLKDPNRIHYHFPISSELVYEIRKNGLINLRYIPVQGEKHFHPVQIPNLK